MNLLRTPAIRDLVQNDLGDLYLRAANPGDALAVEFNLRGEDDGHGFSPGSSIRHEPCKSRLVAHCRLYRRHINDHVFVRGDRGLDYQTVAQIIDVARAGSGSA